MHYRLLKSWTLSFLLLAAHVARAQSGFIPITASHITDAAGHPINGMWTATPTNGQGSAMSFRLPGGGNGIVNKVSCYVANGAITTDLDGGTCQLVDTDLTNPAHVCFTVTIIDGATGYAVQGPGFGCYQPSSSKANGNFDTFVPNNPSLPVQTITGGAGPAGTPGPAGPSAYQLAVASGYSGTLSQWLTSLVGATGAVGPTGPAGPAGATGPAGAQGPQGTGGAGFNARRYWTPNTQYDAMDVFAYGGQTYEVAAPFTSGSTFDPSNLALWAASGSPGAMGPQGATGPAGPTGSAGAAGAQGPIGQTGSTGSTGPQGPAGPAGSTGQQGSAATITIGTTQMGDPGSQASVTNSGTNSAAVLNFTIPQGATGAAGTSATTTYPSGVLAGNNTTSAPTVATSSQMQAAIGQNVYDAAGAAANATDPTARAAAASAQTTANATVKSAIGKNSGTALLSSDYLTDSKPALTNWSRALHNAATTPVEIVVACDSRCIVDKTISTAANSSISATFGNRLVDLMRKQLQSIYGSHGTGMVPVYFLAGNSPTMNADYWSTSSSLTQDGTLGPKQTQTLPYNAVAVIPANGSVTFTTTIPYDHLRLYYEKLSNSGTMTITIDGTAAGTVGGTNSTALAAVGASNAVPLAVHTAVISCNSGSSCYLYAAEGVAGTTGVSVSNVSVASGAMQTFGASPSTEEAFTDIIPEGHQLTITNMETNEVGIGETPTQFANYLNAFISHERGLASAPSILLISPGQDGINISGNAYTDQAPYYAVLAQVATSTQAEFVDIRSRWGNLVDLTYFGPDGAHENNLGNADMYAMVATKLLDASDVQNVAQANGGGSGSSEPTPGTPSIGALTTNYTAAFFAPGIKPQSDYHFSLEINATAGAATGAIVNVNWQNPAIWNRAATATTPASSYPNCYVTPLNDDAVNTQAFGGPTPSYFQLFFHVAPKTGVPLRFDVSCGAR